MMPSAAAQGSPAEIPGADSADGGAADRWIAEWQKGSRPVSGALVLTRFADPIYIVTRTIGWTPLPTQKKYAAVTVPVGFVTDFASIPRVFWSALRPDGDYGYAAIIHDFLYWDQPVSREAADDIFRFAMEDFNVDGPSLRAIYVAVRAGGASAWAENARLKAIGEKRILKRFPEDPTVRWADWKQRLDVF